MIILLKYQCEGKTLKKSTHRCSITLLAPSEIGLNFYSGMVLFSAADVIANRVKIAARFRFVQRTDPSLSFFLFLDA